MVDPRFGLFLLSPLSLFACRHRQALRPIAVAVCALAAIDAARWSGLSFKPSLTLWMLWPACSAALSWAVWRGRRWPIVLVPFIAYALSAAYLPPRGWWPVHRWLYEVATRAPFVTSALVSLLAWALRKDEGPGVPTMSPSRKRLRQPVFGDGAEPNEACVGVPREPATLARLCSSLGPHPDCSPATTSHRSAQACAALLAWSGLVDVTIGALAPGASYAAAGPLAWSTWCAVGVVLVREARRSS